MLLLRKRAFARAGLIGNPSDGYHGKTISLIVRNFFAEVVLYEWHHVELILSQDDHSRFRSVQELARDVQQHGYYGGIRLVKATVKKFVEFCERQGHRLHDRNFSVRYQSTIPRQVGLAGSSAIIVATLRCLMDFYDVQIPLEVQPSLALAVEAEELGLAAGLQDRVIQVYEGVVYMNFAKERMQQPNGLPCGSYERLDPCWLPPLYVAFKREVGKPVQQFHIDIRQRFQQGDPEVLQAMRKFAQLTDQAREAILAKDADRLAALLNENFDTRRSLYRQLPEKQIEMVEVARLTGASAKFAGSGGAIIGIYRDEAMFEQLRTKLGAIGCEVCKPIITP